MAFDEAVAAVIRERLAVMQAIDDSAELSFLESAAFRLALFDKVKRYEDGTVGPVETLAALRDIHQRVDGAVRAAP